jgi:hypothetical protein
VAGSACAVDARNNGNVIAIIKSKADRLRVRSLKLDAIALSNFDRFAGSEDASLGANLSQNHYLSARIMQVIRALHVR